MRSLMIIALLVLLPAASPVIGHRIARSATLVLDSPSSSGRPLTDIERCEDVRVVDGAQGPWVKVRTWGVEGFVSASAFDSKNALASNATAGADDACGGDESLDSMEERAGG